MSPIMNLKKHISAVLVLLTLAMQLLLAQHYTVHFHEDEQIGISHQQTDGHGGAAHDGEHNEDGCNKICQICVFSKNLSQLLLLSFTAALTIACLICGIFFAAEKFPFQNTPLLYSARAPPLFLS